MLTVDLPFPPSLNNLFVNVPGKGRKPSPRYGAWKRVAQTEILAQRPSMAVKRISGPIALTITLQRRGRRMDIDNAAKAIIDVLVSMAVIDDDKNVERLTLEWGDVEGAHVVIVPAEMACTF